MSTAPQRFSLPAWAAKQKVGRKLRLLGKIACPTCGRLASYVIDSRPSDDGVWRRRTCPEGHRYTTIETVREDR